jgi:GDP-L-fucose synthase
MKTIVFGGTGMLGRALTERLKQDGPVLSIGGGYCDMTQLDQIEFVIDEQPDRVFHCAGLVGGIKKNMENPLSFLIKNTQMGINLIDVCTRHRVKHLYNISSSCVYPRECQQPMREEMLGSGSLEPTNLGYALAKMHVIEAVRMARAMGFDYKSMMPCNLYGPGDTFGEGGHVLASLVKKFCDAKRNQLDEVEIWGTGTPRREFLHTADAADAIVAATAIDAPEINIGSGVDIEIFALAARVANVVGWKGNYKFDITKPDGMPRKLLDTRLLNDIQWKQKISLDDGIEQLVKEYNDGLAKI